MIVKLEKENTNGITTTLQILEYLYNQRDSIDISKISSEQYKEMIFDTNVLFYKPEIADGYFYIINISKLKKDFEFCLLLHKNGFTNIDFIAIPEEYVTENREKLIKVADNRRKYGRIENEEQAYNEVFSRYAKNIDTVVVNQNKGTENIINIQDCMSIRNMFLVTDKRASKDYISEMSGYYINPNMAKMFNGKKVEVNMLFELFGINENSLLEKIKQLKEKKLDICLVGLGGTMSNFVYFLNEIINYFKIDDLFENLVIYENDFLEISNLPRIPLDYLTPIHLGEDFNLIAKLDIFRNMRNLFKNNYLELSQFNISKSQICDFVIGSPNIQTRVEMFEYNKKQNFIIPLHYNNELVIFENPKVIDSSISAETYGSIELTYFFLNMFRMTIELIDIMLKDKLEMNKKVFHYNSKESIDEFRENTKKSTNMYVFS